MTTDTWQKHSLFINTALANIVVEQILICRQQGFYKLHAFVLMPDHLHILLTPSETTTIEKAMQMIKGGSSHRMGLERPNKFPVWHSGFHDRWIRDVEEYRGSKKYIEQNPIVAKLVDKPEEYGFSSANGKYVLDPTRFDEVRGGMIYQLSWATLPGLRGLSCSEFRATPTSTPDNERGVAVDCASEGERDALLSELEAHFGPHRFLNTATAFDAVRDFVISRSARGGHG